MLKISFFDKTLDRDELKKFIQETEKPIRYTYGYKYRNPTTMNVPKSKDQALEIVDAESYLDAEESEEWLDLNGYSSNDMW